VSLGGREGCVGDEERVRVGDGGRKWPKSFGLLNIYTHNLSGILQFSNCATKLRMKAEGLGRGKVS